MIVTKIQGAGNDFVVINNFVEKIPEEDFSKLAVVLCRRKLSIGADGLMIVGPATSDADYRMYFYNSDGSIGEMCGNGARCIVKYGLDHGLVQGNVARVETTAGLVTGEKIRDGYYRIQINNPTVIERNLLLETRDGSMYPCTYIELGHPGLPHLIVKMPSDCYEDFLELGRELRFHPNLPKGANVDFYKVLGENEVEAVTYERGVEDFTLACGSGATSTAIALALDGKTSQRGVLIHMPGGDLTIDVRGDLLSGNPVSGIREVYLSGPSIQVMEGEIDEILHNV